jgi:hypothetical protein
MAFSHRVAVRIKPSAQTFQPHILERYNNPLDCLTAHLMLECSEVLAGVKPANLISLVNRTRSCGRNLYQLWQLHHENISSRFSNLTLKVLQTKHRALLLLCYNRDHLERHLTHAGIRVLLKKAGYDTSRSSEALLTELCRRIENSDTFPHEIGLFIGYPAKDVAAFMGMVNLPFACQGPWKIYGDPVRSLDLADQFRCCRLKMSAILVSGDRKALELHNPRHPFFYQRNDMDFHYLNMPACKIYGKEGQN